jgi:polysaccharide biosynthesis/export protein
MVPLKSNGIQDRKVRVQVREGAMRICLHVLATILLISFSTVLGAQETSPKNIKADQVLTARSLEVQPLNSVITDPNYIIGADDVLSIDVWKEPEISRTIPVRPDGKISLPLLNDVRAAGLGPTQLAAQIQEQLRKILVNPQVTVIVTQINSQRIYLLGEVTRGGTYPLLPNMTVLQALSSAGSFTQFANLKKIYILRFENGQQVMLPFQYKEVVSGHKPEQNIHLKAGDTIIVP